MKAELATAIKTFYDSSAGSALAALNTGDLHWENAPQAVSEPYIVFSFVSSSIDDIMGGQNDRIENVDTQFSIISRKDDGGVEIGQIETDLMSWLDWNNFTIADDFTIIAVERIGVGAGPVIDEIAQTTLFYSIWVDW